MALHAEKPRCSVELGDAYSSGDLPCCRGADVVITDALPEHWCRIFESAISGQIDFQAIHLFVHSIQAYVSYGYPLDHPITTWGHDFAEQAINLVVDYLCNIRALTDVYLAEGHTSIIPLRNRMTDLLVLLGLLLKMVGRFYDHLRHKLGPQRTCAECARYAKLLRSLPSNIRHIMDGIWAVRENFLVSEHDSTRWPNCPSGHPVSSAINSLFSSLYGTIYIREALLHTTASASARVALAVWIYATTARDINAASNALSALTHDGKRTGVLIEDTSTFYSEVAYGCTSPRHIQNAMVRDMKRAQGEELGKCIFRAMTLRSSTTIDLRHRYEHKLLMCCLATCRGEMCSGRAMEGCPDGPDNPVARTASYLLSALASSVHLRLEVGKYPLPESTLYAVIPILGWGCVAHLPEDIIFEQTIARKALDNCITLLRRHRQHPETNRNAGTKPPSPHARRFTVRAWKSIRDTMVSKG